MQEVKIKGTADIGTHHGDKVMFKIIKPDFYDDGILLRLCEAGCFGMESVT